MVTVASSSVLLRRSPTDEAELDAIAEIAATAASRFARELLPISDFEVYVRVEEGSIRTRTKVFATLGALSVGIAQFGSLATGVREISRLAREVMRQVNTTVIREAASSPREVGPTRRDDGLPGDLRRLFERVENGHLSADEAMLLAERLLQRSGEAVPPKLLEDLSREIVSISVPQDRIPPARHKATDLPPEPTPPSLGVQEAFWTEDVPTHRDDHSPRPREHPLPSPRRRIVEVWDRPGEPRRTKRTSM
jgi:hypothetical protein